MKKTIIVILITLFPVLTFADKKIISVCKVGTAKFSRNVIWDADKYEIYLSNNNVCSMRYVLVKKDLSSIKFIEYKFEPEAGNNRSFLLQSYENNYKLSDKSTDEVLVTKPEIHQGTNDVDKITKNKEITYFKIYFEDLNSYKRIKKVVFIKKTYNWGVKVNEKQDTVDQYYCSPVNLTPNRYCAQFFDTIIDL